MPSFSRCTRLGLVLSTALAPFASAPFASAQLAGNQSGGSATLSDQGSEAVSEFLGMKVTAQRLIVDPASSGFRVILAVTDVSEASRLASWMAPAPTLIDDMGNSYKATSIVGGMGVCDNLNRVVAANCVYYAPTNLTRMPPNTPVTAVLSFAPVEGAVIAETVPLATTGALTARIAVHEEGANYKEAKAADVVINGLVLPK